MKKFVPDCFCPDTTSKDSEVYESHEAICVLNTSDVPATLKFTFYFEDRDKMDGFTVVVPPERTLHIKNDQLVNDKGEHIIKGVPYAAMIESDVDVYMQYSRLDATQPELALMTTLL